MSVNKADQPTAGDSYIEEKVEALNKVFKLHEKLLESGIDAPPFYPEELSGYLNFDDIESMWTYQSYDVLRRAYVSAWVKYVQEAVGSIYYSVDDFLKHLG